MPVDTTETELNLLDPGTTYTIYVLGITGKERRGKESIQVDVETPAIGKYIEIITAYLLLSF